jgi:elongation factor 1-alpha
MLVNAIDDSIPPWSQERFEQIKRETTELLKKSSIEPENVPFIPVSGWTGDNLVKPSSNLGWYRGQTLLEAIDSLTPPREEKEKLPLRIPIFDVFRVKGAGTVPIGVVLSGTLRLGDVVRVEPLGRECEVRSIETYHMPIEVAVPGDGIGFALKGVAAEELERGSVVCSPKAPATVADSSRRIIARVFISPVAGAGLAFGGITVGMYPEIHVQSAHVKCRVVDIKREVGSTETLPMLEPEQVGVVEFQVIPGKKVVIEKFSTSPEFGRFAIRSGGITIGAGVVLDIVLGK